MGFAQCVKLVDRLLFATDPRSAVPAMEPEPKPWRGAAMPSKGEAKPERRGDGARFEAQPERQAAIERQPQGADE